MASCLFAYDWVMKFTILMYNIKCPRIAIKNDNCDVPLIKEHVLSDLGSGEKVRWVSTSPRHYQGPRSIGPKSI